MCYSDRFLGGKTGLGLVADLGAASSGTITADIASAPYQVEVLTAVDAIPPALGDGWTQVTTAADSSAGTVSADVDGRATWRCCSTSSAVTRPAAATGSAARSATSPSRPPADAGIGLRAPADRDRGGRQRTDRRADGRRLARPGCAGRRPGRARAAPATPLRPDLRGMPADHRSRRRCRRRDPGGDDRHRAQHRPLRRPVVVRHLDVPDRHERQPRRAPPTPTAADTVLADRRRADTEPVDDQAAGRFDAVGERDALGTALAGLAEEFRVPVVLRDVGDLDYAEIAEVLNVPIGTVKSRIARGRGMLAAALGGNRRPGDGRPSERP